MRFAARLCFNTDDWQHPSGVAPRLENDTYASKHGFGHEEWLFRGWTIDGWCYGFIQGINKADRRRVADPFDVMLYTIDDRNVRRWVATISEVHTLSDTEAEAARAVFQRRGWLDQMRREVRAVDGKPGALNSRQYAKHLLNIRFRPAALTRFDQPIPKGDPFFARRNRYKLYALSSSNVAKVQQSLRRTRRPHRGPIQPLRIFRKPTPASEYSVEHRRLQQRLVSKLERQYGKLNVSAEGGYVDVTVTRPRETIYYEIKTDDEARLVVRHALGQLLEYAFHSHGPRTKRVRLVIVGQCSLNSTDRQYLHVLRQQFNLPVEYLRI